MQIKINPNNQNDTEMKLRMLKKECLSMSGCEFNIHNILNSLGRLQAGLTCGLSQSHFSNEITFFKKMGINLIIIKDGNNDD